MASEQSPAQSDTLDAEVLVIGAGVTGIHQLHRLREVGFDARIVEAGSGVGGTWYWNRYPGARFDSESYSYGYFFSEELLQTWRWSEHFAGQAETERYLNVAVDTLGLRPHIRTNTRITGGRFDEGRGTWTLRTGEGEELRCRFVVAATGVLSVPYWPDLPGRERYRGQAYHTGQWPHRAVDFRDQHVAVIGTGASAVQLIPVIADEVDSLTVYQRTPNWCAPLNNGPITAAEQEELAAAYHQIHELCRNTFAGFVHRANPLRTFEATTAERRALYEQLYHARGFAKLLSNYRDLMTNAAANAEFSRFLADKIRARVDDPAVAEKLIPRDHGFGMRRPPMETRYYEAYNRPNVHLVDLHDTPIVSITEDGIETTAGERRFDIIVWATGFDGFSGALMRLDLEGVGGRTLRRDWSAGPRTYLGLQCAGFPNLFLVGGPHTAAGNFPRATEPQVDFVTGLLAYARLRGHRSVAPEPAAVDEWTRHVAEAAGKVLIAETSWFRGSNIPGKAQVYQPYAGSLVALRERLEAIADNGYPGFVFDRVPLAPTA
ncbi:MAG: flavin-containing monooxygenase [Acidimicrobiia bacterium]